jgi:hypothetical protein
MPLVWGWERLTLLDDGRRLHMLGEHRFFPTPWRVRVVSGTGAIDEAALCATYDLQWLGAPFHQVGTSSADRQTVELVQQTAFMRSRQLLQRVR